jgi:hypothetical protein
MRRCFVMALGVLALLAGRASAEPVLQLYVEGASYNTATATWTISSSIGDSIKLWVIADTGSRGPVDNVKLFLAGSAADNLQYSISPTRIGGLPTLGSYVTPAGVGTFTDSGLPATPAFVTSQTGTAPPGLSPHGVYGSGVLWREYSLGDFNHTPLVKIGDFSTSSNGSQTVNPSSAMGQIYAYDIAFTGASHAPTWLNIDATGYYLTSNKHGSTRHDVFAPYSHTARGGIILTPSVPEPSSMAIAALGGIGCFGYCLRRRGRR